ncbi:MAG: inorganic diphosphatase [Rhodospirillaceae bacterium]|nr:inorganic diphosphatase [Rhodospirillaceae bacterium]
MDINLIPVGEDPPWDVNVIIENPLGGSPVKYEIDKTSRAIFVDRFLHTAMFYPGNYGFIPHTLAGDGDPMDVIVVGQVPVIAGAVLRSRPVGMMRMEDEAGEDEKILAVPVDKLHPYFSSVTNYDQLPATLLEQIAHFFSHYKDLEKEKWVKVQGWEDAEAAAKAINKSIDRGRKAAGR